MKFSNLQLKVVMCRKGVMVNQRIHSNKSKKISYGRNKLHRKLKIGEKHEPHST